MLNIQISLSFNINLKPTISVFSNQAFPKSAYPVKNKKSKQHHLMLHIGISLRTKFQPKLSSVIFWSKFMVKNNINKKSEGLH